MAFPNITIVDAANFVYIISLITQNNISYEFTNEKTSSIFSTQFLER